MPDKFPAVEALIRSAEHAAETASNLDLFHGPDAAAGLVGMFTDMRATA